MILYTELQEKILSVIQQNISGYKSLRESEVQLLNTKGNDDEKTLEHIQEYTSDITKLTDFQTRVKSLFTKANGQGYNSNILIKELMKLCAESYNDITMTLTNFYSDIIFQAVSDFITKDNNTASS